MSTASQIALFLHLCFLLVGIGAATVMGVAASKLRTARTGAEAFPWGMLAKKTALGFPIAIVGLLATGGYMANKNGWDWGSGWIVTAIGGLAFLMAEGAILGGGHGKKLGAALKENGPGPVGEKVRELTSDRLHWAITFAAPGLVLGIVWNMIRKPGLGMALVDMVVGYAIGAALGLWLASRTPAVAPEAPAARA